MKGRVNIHYRDRLARYCERHPRPWKPDFRDGKGLDWMLVALCGAVSCLAVAIVWWGGR